MILCPHCREACAGKCSRALRPGRRWFIFGSAAALAAKAAGATDGLWISDSHLLDRKMFGMSFVVTPKAPPNTITMIAPLEGYRPAGSPDDSLYYAHASVAQADLSTGKIRSGRVEATFRW